MAAAPTSFKRTRSASQSRFSEPSFKRARNEGATPGPAKFDDSYVIDSGFSNLKGDIYLKVGNTLFPASLEKLQNVEGLFADLFSIQQPEHADRIHGLPYCDMFNCSESELRVLMKLIHGSKYVFQRKAASGVTEFNIENILDALLVSSRLDLPGIRTQAKEAIHDFFRTMWSHIIYCEPPPEYPVVALTGYTMGKDNALRVLCFRMIKVFRECELGYCMPMAYYFAAQQTHNDILDGIKLPDGSLLELDHDDKKKVLKGREMLRSLRRNVTFMWLIEHAGYPKDYVLLHGCTSREFPKRKGCYDFIFDLYNLFFSPSSRLLEDRCDALESISFEAVETMKSHLCPECQVYFTDRIMYCLLASWGQIPRIFTGHTWDKLREKQIQIEANWRERLS
ncbi:hypothetical protein LENED_007393 [Lentinula edodes]|uniref:BTB domain-containing protein n=1 Tax=Lentinula edodes TaxID=5353 RepID=A0A1Q3EE95_LENED|nr:hypothetical protein LENED_007393 [Lentinula edodes]